MTMRRTLIGISSLLLLGAFAAHGQFGFLKLEPPPIKQDGHTMVPTKQIAEAFKAKMTYDKATKKLTGKRDKYSMVMTIGSKTAKIGGKTVKLPVAPKVVEGTAFVPLRDFAKGIGVEVEAKPDRIKLCTDDTCVMIKPPAK
jgi:hypothetical protein